jgi:hypothetical protein
LTLADGAARLRVSDFGEDGTMAKVHPVLRRDRVGLVGAVLLLVTAAGCIGLSGVAPTPTGLATLAPPATGIPSQIGGEHVYRASDLPAFGSTAGSFLLGGRVTHNYLDSPCATVAGPPGEGQGLLPYCGATYIDGLPVSPLGGFDAPDDALVVARVHENDPAAAKCLPELLMKCEAVIVVESVVWPSSGGPSASTH